ncbi:DNA-binding protein [Amnibacterium flavum]|uniref:DNA-binding protein n=2 Tax=Amnibacterium flavum TaxID=2173173 RepID=A0A2V1HLA6_9MICO|nr:DNA-binding protein [Amnibacterium flavum]
METAHDREVATVVATLEDGTTLTLEPRLTRFVIDIIEAIAASGVVSTTTLPEILTSSVAAECLGISRPTLMKIIERGEIPAFKVGTHTRLRRDDVFALRRARQEARGVAVRDLRDAGADFD